MNHVMNDINMYEWTCNLELNSRIQGLKSGFIFPKPIESIF